VLPHGIFPNQKLKFGFIVEGLAMEDVDIFMAILSIYIQLNGIFMAIWYILCFLVYFSRFGILYREKSGNPASAACSQRS
jgi:hypothetical protein